MKTWKADDSEWGRGKVHVVSDEDSSKTVCGRTLKSIGGREVSWRADCRSCANGIESRLRRAERQVEWDKEAGEREAKRKAEREEWMRNYSTYLASPQWKALRLKVMKRANGLCEGCGDAPAVQVHHLSYANVGREFLFELVAVCVACHERAHDGGGK